MKVVLLAGGFGTRLGEETSVKPKPMVEIGGKPILWHIMKLYQHYGYNEFIVCLGYKGDVVKDYFLNYLTRSSDIEVDLNRGGVNILNRAREKWKVTLVDTGLNTMTGGRLKRISHFIGNETFMMTYGDGISDINLNSLLAFHKSHGKLATVSAVKPKGRFGSIDIGPNSAVTSFTEKAEGGDGWVSAGFFVLEASVLKLIKNYKTIWENEPLMKLSRSGQLVAFRHHGFWKPMDTLSDKFSLEELWNSSHAPWKVWND